MKLRRLKSPEEIERLKREIHEDLLKYDPTRRRIEMLENENFQLRILVKELKKSLIKTNHPSVRNLDLEEEGEKDFSFIYQRDDSLKGMLS